MSLILDRNWNSFKSVRNTVAILRTDLKEVWWKAMISVSEVMGEYLEDVGSQMDRNASHPPCDTMVDVDPTLSRDPIL